MSVIVFACVFGGAVIGIFLRNRLPDHHLSGDTKDVVRLGTGLIGTIAALVLGLLIASANSTFETRSTQVQQLTADIVLLDRILLGEIKHVIDEAEQMLAVGLKPFEYAKHLFRWFAVSGQPSIRYRPGWR
jgi:hypothetical protein